MKRFKVLFLWMALSSCAADDLEKEKTSHKKQAIEDSSVIVDINGTKIRAKKIIELSRKNSKHPNEIVHTLVQLELLAKEAKRQKLHLIPEILETKKKIMVQKFLKDTIEIPLAPSKIPKKYIKKAYKLNIRRYVRPELVKVYHLAVLLPKKPSKKELKESKKLAYKIWKQAKEKKPLPKEFLNLKKEFKDKGFKIIAEKLPTFSQKARYQQAFIKAAFKLHSKGEISRPVKTSYGWHIIYLIERSKPIHRSLKEVEREIRERVSLEFKQQRFETLIKKLWHKSKIKIYKENLALLKKIK